MLLTPQFRVKVLLYLSSSPRAKQSDFLWRVLRVTTPKYTCATGYIFVTSLPVNMSGNGGFKKRCARADCDNDVDAIDEFCFQHKTSSTVPIRNICEEKGCVNTAEFSNLCMICHHRQKFASRHEKLMKEKVHEEEVPENAWFEEVEPMSKPFATDVYEDNAIDPDNPVTFSIVLPGLVTKPKSRLVEEDAEDIDENENTLIELVMHRENELATRCVRDASVTISDNRNAIKDECEYANIVLTTNTTNQRTRKRKICLADGCTREVPDYSIKCLEHEIEKKPINKTICQRPGCDNSADVDDGYLCMVCAHDERRALKSVEFNRAPVGFNSTFTTVQVNSLPENRTWQVQSNNRISNLTALANSLPPIPKPTIRKPKIPKPTTPTISLRLGAELKNDETAGIEILARGMPDGASADAERISLPSPLSNLPPIPMPFNRSNSTPSSCSSLIFSQISIDSIQPRTPSFPGTITISSLCGSIPVMRDDTMVSTSLRDELCELSHTNISQRPICKREGCRRFVDERFGDYCSDCLMVYNAYDNEPPSCSYPLASLDIAEEYAHARYLEGKPCRGDNCEFFGNDDFDGYCSGCHKKESVKVSQERLGKDNNEDRMCIICLQNVYNTVLLPCGHLYLCFECATTIKKNRRKCPACRSYIESLHRVYTPD